MSTRGRFSLLLSLAGILVATCAWQSVDRQEGRRIKLGRLYARQDYGFNVSIPPEVVAYGPYCFADGVCGSTHGFTGSLSIDKHARISLFAEYNPAYGEPPRLAMSNADVREYVLAGGHPADAILSVLSSKAAMLDTLSATRITATVRRPGSSEDTYLDITYALRIDPGHGSILYRIVLESSPTRFERDKAVMDKLIRNFRITPVTN
jgi:hypothetical protein